MRLSTTLLVLSAASLVFGQCAVCPKKVKGDTSKAVFRLVLHDHDSSTNTTFCGYKQKSKTASKNEGYCSYDDTGKMISDDLKCPDQVKTRGCKKGE
ncbi:hypothetical protein C8R46DRAFT_1075679 [Mycena filopes]|nr:hypothetical protein C8R46DRAFT_1075679 [Mycena filopes]